MAQATAQSATPHSALRTGTAVQLRPTGGVLELGGEDRVDFLQRMTTNNVLALRPGQSCVTVLTSPTAKIIHVFTVLARDGALWLLPALGETDALARHLRGQIFFMDKVTVTDHSKNLARLRLMGPGAASTLTALGVDLKEAADGEWCEQNGIVAVRQNDYDVAGLEVVAPTGQVARLSSQLAEEGVVLLEDDNAYHLRRIEMGRPIPGAELTSEYSPLEAGLAWACAENKGCYTGQEIIARQLTYDKVTRSLTGLRSTEEISVGAAVVVDGREVGMVTSTAWDPATPASIALAVVKRSSGAAGTLATVGSAAVEVVSLPFVE